MSAATLPMGVHDYESILEGIRNDEYRFAEAMTYDGKLVPIIGLPPEVLSLMESLSTQNSLPMVLYGSRVAGPRTYQRKLHRVLACRKDSFLVSTSRHRSVGFPEISGVTIPKDAIKELGILNPLTSDLTVAVISGHRSAEELLPVVEHIETEINSQLSLTFQVRVYLTVFGVRFETLGEFVAFGRDRYIKQDLVEDHQFTDSEIEDAFKGLFILIEPTGRFHDAV